MKNNSEQYLKPEVISKIKSFELKAKLVVEGFMVGLHKSPYHGFSIEFSQHRPYSKGDNLKDLDWKVLAKTDKHFIKQYEEETNLRSYILLDTSKSMSFSSKNNLSKFEYGSVLTAALSYLMIKQQDAVGMILYSDVIEKNFNPKSSKQYLQEILKTLSKTVPGNKTNTAESLNAIAEKLTKRGLIIIISDFFDDVEKIIKTLKHFRYNNNEVILFQILDPLERSFAFGSDAIFKDLETGAEITTNAYQIQKAYQNSFEEYLDNIKKECLNLHIDYNLITTDIPFDKAIFAYFQKRKRLY